MRNFIVRISSRLNEQTKNNLDFLENDYVQAVITKQTPFISIVDRRFIQAHFSTYLTFP